MSVAIERLYYEWVRQGIMEFSGASGFGMTVTLPVRVWMIENVGTVLEDWWWDELEENKSTINLFFKKRIDAIRFSLEWL